MIHFDERRVIHSTRWPDDEEPIWRNAWPPAGKSKKNRKKELAAKAALPKTHRIDVIPEYKSGPYKNVYWMHPNMAITRESRGQEEFVGEVTFYQGVNSNVVVNFFTGLDFYEHAKLRFAHSAHTPPSSSSRPAADYLKKNMEVLLKKLDILMFKQTIIESRPENN